MNELAAVICSPPWAGSINDGGNHDSLQQYPGWSRNPDGSNRMAASVGTNYGTTAGQLGALKPGTPPGEVTMECEELDWHGGLYSRDGAELVPHALGDEWAYQFHETPLAGGSDPESPLTLPCVQSPRAKKCRDPGNVGRRKGNRANGKSAALAATAVIHEPECQCSGRQTFFYEGAELLLSVRVCDLPQLGQEWMTDGMETVRFVGSPVTCIESPMDVDRSGEWGKQAVLVVQVGPLLEAMGALQVGVAAAVQQQASVPKDRADDDLLLLIAEVGKSLGLSEAWVAFPSVMPTSVGRIAFRAASGSLVGGAFPRGPHYDLPAIATWHGLGSTLALPGAIDGGVGTAWINLEWTAAPATEKSNHSFIITTSVNLARVRNPVVQEVEELDWPMSQVYGELWGNLLVPEAMAHPAKMSRKLLNKILDFCLERGFLAPGSLVADPFGGVGTTGLLAAYRGLRAISVELEPRFVALAQQNYDLHRRELEILGCPLPVIVQGDSRNFAQLVNEAAGIVTSPPYAGISPEKNGSGIDKRKQWETYRASGGGLSYEAFVEQQARHSQGYGSTAGQLAAMPPGDVAAVLTSPPWEASLQASAGIDTARRRQVAAELGKSQDRVTPRDIETATGSKAAQRDYGASSGQVGRESGDTYWAAVRDIYAQCLLALRPGGWLVCVVKGYVSKGKLVDLPAQTAALLTHLGFDLRILARAWLVERKEHAGLFGQTVVEEKSRESFFRRLAVKKGSPRIPFETVLFCQKPDGGPGGGLDAAVTSPPYAETDIAAKKTSGSYGDDYKRTGRSPRALQEMECERYGATIGQLGSLPAGSLDDVLKEDA